MKLLLATVAVAVTALSSSASFAQGFGYGPAYMPYRPAPFAMPYHSAPPMVMPYRPAPIVVPYQPTRRGRDAHARAAVCAACPAVPRSRSPGMGVDLTPVGPYAGAAVARGLTGMGVPAPVAGWAGGRVSANAESAGREYGPVAAGVKSARV
jgi:hypothetical protein